MACDRLLPGLASMLSPLACTLRATRRPLSPSQATIIVCNATLLRPSVALLTWVVHLQLTAMQVGYCCMQMQTAIDPGAPQAQRCSNMTCVRERSGQCVARIRSKMKRLFKSKS